MYFLIGAARLLRIPSIAPMAAIQIVFGKFYKTILTFVVITVISVKNDTSATEAATPPHRWKNIVITKQNKSPAFQEGAEVEQ